MKKITLVSLTICLILVIVLAISASSLADIALETNTKAEQYFEKANKLLKRADYEAAIAEYKKVLNISSNSKIAQDAQYWIGQSHFRAGQFDAAQATFAKLIEEYPASAIVPVTKLMVGRVRQAKEIEEKIRAISNTADKGFIIDPYTGVKYTKTTTFVGKRDVIEYTALNLSPNGKFLLCGNLVVPLDGGEPFNLVDMTAYNSTWSPDGKKVAFYSGDAICVVPVSAETGRAIGSAKKLLYGDYEFYYPIGWSPDSEKLVFRRNDKEVSGDIWTLSVKDGALTQITDDPLREGGPSWSPDGETIAYTTRKDRRRSVRLISAEGGTPKSIIDFVAWGWEGGYPLWSPDGQWILYRSRLLHLTDEQELEIIPPSGVGGFFSWSPDGKKMLFYRPSYDYKYGFKVVSASGGLPLDLVRQQLRQHQFYGTMTWSPDSKTIIARGWIEGNNEDGGFAFWIIPLSGDDPVPLEMDVSVDGKPSPDSVFPNGKKLSFSVKSDDGTEDVFVVPISLKDARTTGPAVKVFDDLGPGGGSWSPDGDKLAVIHRDDVWITSSNGDKPVQITKTPEKKRWPGWSPDGKMIKYAVISSRYVRRLYVVPASGGKATKILDNCRIHVWSPDSKEIAVVLNDLISIVPIAGGDSRQIAKLKDLGIDWVCDLRWSPDGKYIACVGGLTVKGNYSGPIFVIPVEGGEATTLATDDNSSKYRIFWSPDSKWIAYGSEGFVKMRPEGTMWEAYFEEIVKKASR